MRILVSGGAGFIGSALCRYLVGELGHEVLVVDKLAYAGKIAALKSIANLPLCHVAETDLSDRAALDWLFDAFRPAGVVHLPAASHRDNSVRACNTLVEHNFNGTAALLEAARAFWARLPAREQDDFRLLHVSPHGLAAGRTRMLNAWTRSYGLPVMVSTSSNSYGPFQFPSEPIPRTILAALHGLAVPVYADGSSMRDWLHVEDHARALFRILTDGRPGATYQVAARSERRNIDVVRRLCAILDELRPGPEPYESQIAFRMNRPDRDGHDPVDPVKLESELGWRAEETFESGLEKTVRWYLANAWWWQALADPLEDDQPRAFARAAG